MSEGVCHVDIPGGASADDGQSMAALLQQAPDGLVQMWRRSAENHDHSRWNCPLQQGQHMLQPACAVRGGLQQACSCFPQSAAHALSMLRSWGRRARAPAPMVIRARAPTPSPSSVAAARSPELASPRAGGPSAAAVPGDGASWIRGRPWDHEAHAALPPHAHEAQGGHHNEPLPRRRNLLPHHGSPRIPPSQCRHRISVVEPHRFLVEARTLESPLAEEALMCKTRRRTQFDQKLPSRCRRLGAEILQRRFTRMGTL